MDALFSGRLWSFQPRWFFRRRPLLFWAGTLLLATVTGVVVAGIVGEADTARRALGEHRTIVVAADYLDVGTVIEPSHLVERSVPLAFAPEHAVDDVPVGRVVRSAILAGEPFALDRVGVGGDGTFASALPPNTAGMALPLVEPALPLAPGDRVDVWSTSNPFGAGSADAVRSADGALVIEVGDGRVIVAVEQHQVGPLTLALHTGSVELVLTKRH